MDKKIKNEPGIYEILNTQNNKRYIGQSIHIRKRLLKHVSMLRKNKHTCKHLQDSWNKYGEENFQFNVIEYCNIEDLDNKENFYIAKFQANNNAYGYNYRIDNKTNRGLKWSEEHREKMKNAIENNPWFKNHTIPLEIMQKAWEASRNKTWTEEERKKHSKILTGTKVKDTSNMKKAQTGEGNNSHKLSEKEVLEIINLLQCGYKVMDLALVYNVSHSNISTIKAKRSWKHIDRESVITQDNKERGVLKIYEYNKTNKEKITII